MKMGVAEWRRLGEAMQFYTDLGYTPISVPWAVPRWASSATFIPTDGYTTPGQFPYDRLANQSNLDAMDSLDLVGSGEQGFVQFIIEGKVDPDTPYVTCTPCFRTADADKSPAHAPYFMKVELFELGDLDCWVSDPIRDAYGFFERYVRSGLAIVGGKEKNDIEVNGIEVGSYGARTVNLCGQEFSWQYGTGLAEPRFGHALAYKQGYHLASIAKGEVGKASKVAEECEEFLDAVRQNNPLLALMELSDLLGAMRCYLEKNHPEFSVETLTAMNDSTHRAFRAKERK